MFKTVAPDLDDKINFYLNANDTAFKTHSEKSNVEKRAKKLAEAKHWLHQSKLEKRFSERKKN